MIKENNGDKSLNKVNPSYLDLYQKGELQRFGSSLEERLRSCDLCPRQCGVDRTSGETGVCGVGERVIIASWSPHFGEERILVGRGGSGTIFIAGCNLSCIFCQNYTISHLRYGGEVSPRELASVMLRLQREGCENCNIVTPTHVVPQIIEALLLAIPEGYRLPLVYNSGGYDSAEVLKKIRGIFDIFLPDFKYADPEMGKQLSGVSDYPERAEEALREMFSQVGPVKLSARGTVERGVLVRHLYLPENLADSKGVIDTIAGISPLISVNIMDQYHPEFKAKKVPALLQRPGYGEFRELVSYASKKVTLVRT